MNQKTNKIIVLVGVIIILGLMWWMRKGYYQKNNLIEKLTKEDIFKCESFLQARQEFRGKIFIPDWVMCRIKKDKIEKIPYEELFHQWNNSEPTPRNTYILSINLPKIFEEGLRTIPEPYNDIKPGMPIEIPQKFIICFSMKPYFKDINSWRIYPEGVILDNKNYSEIEEKIHTQLKCTKILSVEDLPIVSLVTTLPSKQILVENLVRNSQKPLYAIKLFVANKNIEGIENITVENLIKNPGANFSSFYRFQIPIIFSN